MASAPTAARAHEAARAEEEEVLPRRLGNYELLEVIGRGGMGVIYRARHVALDRLVALKLIRSPVPNREELVRFVAEAQVTGQIEHPNVAPVHEVGSDEGGRPFFVMKLVGGRSLSKVLLAIQKGDAATVREYPRARLLGVFCQVCQAVAFAHSKGILHRDLKPSNIMIGDFGEVLLVDWGLARYFWPPGAGLPRGAGSSSGRWRAAAQESRAQRAAGPDPRFVMVAGTPEYMSPEQAGGEAAALAPPSDVYSLGAMLFELLTFRPPHIDPETTRLLRKIATEPAAFPRPGRYIPRVPQALRAIALKALALRPEQRYPTAQALLEDVQAFLDDRPVSACPDTAADKLVRLVKRHGALLATAAAALIVLSAGAALAFWRLNLSAEQERAALKRLADQRELLLREAREREAAEKRARAEAEARAKAEREKRLAETAHLQQAASLAKAIPLYLDALELLKRRQHDRAIEMLQRVVEIDPFSPTAALAQFACGEAYERKGTPADARAAIANYAEADNVARQSNARGDPRALLRCGEVAWRMLHDAPQALRFYEAAAAVDPDNPFARLGRAYALILHGREEQDPAAVGQKARQALDLALQVVEQAGFLWEAHYVAGTLFAGMELPAAGLRDLAKAHHHFSQALILEPGAPDAWLGRAFVSRQMGDRTAGLSDYDTAVRLRPDSAAALQGRGELLLAAGRTSEALRDLERAFALAPENYALRLSRAAALLAEKKLPEAEAALDEALKARPDDPQAWFLRGRANFMRGDFGAAVTALERAEALGDHGLEALKLRAAARLKAGQAPAAAQEYRRILERDPAGSEAWKGLGDALRAQGQVKEALNAYQTYLIQQPANIEVRLDLARLRYSDPGTPWYDPPAALQAARDAQRQAGAEDPRVWLVLAEALMAAGQTDEALQTIEQAYTRFPTNTEIQAGRKRLQERKQKK